MQKTHDVMRVMASVQNAITKNKAPQMRGWVASGRCVQAMYTAMKASRKIMAAPTAGITTGIRCTTDSAASVAVAASTSAALGAMGWSWAMGSVSCGVWCLDGGQV